MNSWINPHRSALFSATSFCGEESLARTKKEIAATNVLGQALGQVKANLIHYRVSPHFEKSSLKCPEKSFFSRLASGVKLQSESRVKPPGFESYTKLNHEQKELLGRFWTSLSEKEQELWCPKGSWQWQAQGSASGVVVLALSKGNLPAALALLECFDSLSEEDLKTLITSALNKGFVEGGYFLITNLQLWPEGNCLNQKDGIGRTLGWIAARENNASFMKDLIERKVDIDVADKYGWTPLLVAANAGHLPVVKALSSENINVGAMDAAGWMPLHRACLHGHAPVAQTLIIEMSAQADIPDYLGRTPLHRAVERNRVDIVRFLCEHCDVNPEQAGFVEGYSKPVSCRQLAIDRCQGEICHIFEGYKRSGKT